MSNNTHIETVLLADGYSKTYIDEYYVLDIHATLFQSISMFTDKIAYCLKQRGTWTDHAEVYITSPHNDFDKTYAAFKQQCEIHLTTKLFDHA
jgi:hypothetical protein